MRLPSVTDQELARYLRRLQDAPALEDVLTISRELSKLPPTTECVTLLRTIGAMVLRRVVQP